MFSKKQNQKIFLIAVLVGFSPLASAEGSCATDASYGAGCGGNYPTGDRYEWRTKVYIDGDGQITHTERQLGDLDEPEGTEFYNQYGMEVPPEHLDEYIDHDY